MKTSFLSQLMLPQFAVGILETGFNQVIKRSPHVTPQLRLLAGKILQITLNSPTVQLFTVFSETRVDWLKSYEGEVDCAITLEAGALPKLADKSKLTDLINQKQLILNGDIQVLQHFTVLLDELEKNPAELLSPLVGDVAAQLSTNLVSGIASKFKKQAVENTQNMVDNLMVECPVLVHRLQFVDFSDQVAELAQQAVKFEQKFAMLIKP